MDLIRNIIVRIFATLQFVFASFTNFNFAGDLTSLSAKIQFMSARA